MNLTKSQKKSVEKIFEIYKDGKKTCSFKAPTGSGKTFMASTFISKVFNDSALSGKKTIVIVATVSNSELPKEFSKKLQRYKKFHEYNQYDIEYITSPSNSKSAIAGLEDVKEFDVVENMVYVFGVSSFGKNTLFFKNNTLNNFFTNCKNANFNVVFIRDEAHIGGGKKTGVTKQDLKTFDEITSFNSNFTLEMTATPKSRENLVELKKEDLIEDGVFLLKDEMKLPIKKGDVTNEEIIDEAIDVFIKSKKQYSKLPNVIIKPAMLIQVMNESDYEKDPIRNEEFNEGLKLLEEKLFDAGLIYLKYLDKKEVIGSNLDATLEYASKNDSSIDAIIFKVGPATGWDIPRANMILQLRNVSSESLNIQTVGRIMRNPFPNLEKNPTTNKYYVYSNYQKPTRESATYKLKDKFLNKKLFKGSIDRENSLITKNVDNYRLEVIKFINSSSFLNVLNDWELNQIVYENISYGGAVVKNTIKNFVRLKIFNLQKHMELNENLMLDLFYETLKEISIKLNINIEIVKYFFYSFSHELSVIKSRTSDWYESGEPYKIDKENNLLKSYQIWVDNIEPKKVSIKDMENYGYLQITGEEEIQFLDSTPEQQFFVKFIETICQEKFEKIKFFAKMPTLGSQIYFEYYSKINGKISKSFMDFAIEYNDKTIMIETKSRDQDYSIEKTNELLDAYKIYMERFKEEKINLVLHQYDKKNEIHFLHMMIDGEWKEDISFTEAFDYLFD